MRTTKQSKKGRTASKTFGFIKRGNRKIKKIVLEKNPELDDDEVARRSIIGGAVRYADLSQDRTLDYVFS